MTLSSLADSPLDFARGSNVSLLAGYIRKGFSLRYFAGKYVRFKVSRQRRSQGPSSIHSGGRRKRDPEHDVGPGKGDVLCESGMTCGTLKPLLSTKP